MTVEPERSLPTHRGVRIEPVPERAAGRHPGDGWIPADPMPMAPATLEALRGLIRALCPAAPAPWSPALAERVEQGTRVVLRYMPPLLALGFRLSLHFLDLAPIWTFHRFARLRDLDRAAAGRVLQGLYERGPRVLRILVLGARAAVLSTYYDQDEVHEAMGYAPLPFIEGRAALRRRLLAGEAPGPEALLVPDAGGTS